MLYYKISESYTDTPGPRLTSEGTYSGEAFREEVLEKLYLQAREEGKKVTIDLDGGYGYANSFLEEAFGGLARKYDEKSVLNTFNIISDEMPEWIEDIKGYILNTKGS